MLLPLISFAQDIIEPTINFIPNSSNVDINNDEEIKFDASTNAKRPDIFLEGIKNIDFKAIRTKDNIVTDSKTFLSIDMLAEYTFKPDRPGNYRILFKVEMKSGYIYDDSILMITIKPPTIIFIPDNYFVNISNNEAIKFDVFTNARHPDIFLEGIKNIDFKAIRTKDEILIDSKTFTSLDMLTEYTFKPDRPGSYRIFFKAEMKSGYIYDDSIFIKAVNIPVETLPPIVQKFADSFEVEIPLPDIVYKALDLAFVMDKSGSMANEISATKLASKNIFAKLKELTDDVKASVITFSDYSLEQNSNIYDTGNYRLIIPPTSNPANFENIPTVTTGSSEFQFFALYKTAKNNDLWREGSVKLLVLMTDETDSVYCSSANNCATCDFDKEVIWKGIGRLNVKEINTYLSENDFSATVLYNEIDGDACYGNSMRAFLGNKFAGTYHIPDDARATQQIVNNLYNSLVELIKSAVIFLEPLDDERQIINKIEPVKPQQCIDVTHQGFNYECAKGKGNKVRFKITTNKKELNVKRYNFLLVIKTDKGSLVAVQPVSLTF